jgi:hypothetical protein
MFVVVKHPITHKYTNLFSDALNELLHQGYTIQDILKLSKQIPDYYNRENIFSNDLLINYMYHLELKDILSLLLVDKHASILIHDKYLWKIKISNIMVTGYTFKEDYSLDNYKKCVYANKCKQEHYVMNEYTFTFNPKDDLTKITGPRTNYNKNMYESQQLSIKNDSIQFFASINNISYKSKPLILSNSQLDRHIFNIFYYFPDVKISYHSDYLF